MLIREYALKSITKNKTKNNLAYINFMQQNDYIFSVVLDQ